MRVKLSSCAAVIAFGLIGSGAYAEELTPGTKLQVTPGVTRTVIQKSKSPIESAMELPRVQFELRWLMIAVETVSA